MVDVPGPAKPHVILTPDSRLKVFVSSTLKELAEEREAAGQAIRKLRLQPVMFEAGARPYPARELYQAYLSQSHVFIGIYWQSYGWVGPEMDISGLEDEFNLSAHLPRLIYIKSPAPEREPGLKRMLERLQKENTASYKHFSSSTELGELVENDLALLLSESYEAASRAPEAEFAPKPLTNIPFPRNPLLGRSQELETVCRWITQDDTGLVTITGAGGCGKSRLAIEAALRLRNDYQGGVYLVRLTAVNDPQRVIPTIAETLGLHETARGRPLPEVLRNYLRGRRMLLLLDNFEQVLGAAREIADLLEACPELKLLVTTRAALHVRGEKELALQPLPVPNPKTPAQAESLSQYASVELFIQRARSVQPDFEATNDNAPALAEICYRLDGLPLAIELAAARIRLLGLQELLARLGRRFDLLRGGTRDLPERQQTMRGTIDWSYNLLSEATRAVFRRLSVFAGSFSLDGAEAVCRASGGGEDSRLEQIEELVDFSLLTPLGGLDGRRRFSMLECIREYATERLDENGESNQARSQAADFLLRLAQDVEPRIRSSARSHWRAVLEQDLDNIRGILDWTIASREAIATAQRLIIALDYFWFACGYMSEGRQYAVRLEALIEEETPPSIRAGLFGISKTATLLQGGASSEEPDWDAVIEMARRSGERYLHASILLRAGAWALARNDPTLAWNRFAECQPMFHELGDEWSETLATIWMGNAVSLQGDDERARQLYQHSLVLARGQGDPWLLVFPLIDATQEAMAAGNLDQAETTARETESMLRAAGDQWTRCWPLTVLAHVYLLRGNLQAASDSLQEALQLGHEYGNMMAQVFCLVGAGCYLALRYSGEATDARSRERHLSNAARLCGATGSFVDLPILLGSTSTRSIYNGLIEQVRMAIEPSLWEEGMREGAMMQVEQAKDLALSELRQDSYAAGIVK